MRTHFDTPIAVASIVAADESANVRTFTLQVRDRLNTRWKRRWRVRLWISSTASGDATGGHTVSFGTGTVVETILIGGEWEVRSSTDGEIVVSVTIAGAATRYIHAAVVDKDRASAEIGWAA